MPLSEWDVGGATGFLGWSGESALLDGRRGWAAILLQNGFKRGFGGALD